MKHYLQLLGRRLLMLAAMIAIGAGTLMARSHADDSGVELQYWSLDGNTRYATEPTDNQTIVVYYTFDTSSKTIKSAGVKNPQSQENLTVVIPSELEVRHIADNAFEYNYDVTSLELPGTLESIGSKAFVLPNLKKLTFTGHLNTDINMADDAYTGGTLLTDETSTVNFTVDGNNDSQYDAIDVSYSFCPAKKVLNVTGIDNKGIGSEITILGSIKLSNQFYADDCRLNGMLRGSDFTDVTITDGLKNLGATGEEGEFANCTKLNTVTLPKTFDMDKSSTTASEKTFDGCTAIKTIKVFWKGVPYIADWSKQEESDNNKIARITIDKTRLNAEAIENVELWYVVSFIPGWEGTYTDNTLPAGSFQDCTTIKNVTIHTAPNISKGEHIKILGNDCFNGCTSLMTVNVDEGKLQYGSYDDVTTDYYGCEKIGNSCFKGCTSLEYVTVFTNDATYFQIGDECFSGCTNLDSNNNVRGLTVNASYHRLNGKNSVKAVFGKNCFYGCGKLSKISLISIANVMLSTGSFANSGIVGMDFKDCPLVENNGFDADAKGMVLPSKCFANCNYLTSINFAQTIDEKKIASDAFADGYQWKSVGFYHKYSSGSFASRLHCTFRNYPETGDYTTRKGKYVEITGADTDADGLSLEIPEEISFCKAAGMSSDVIVLNDNCFADVKFGSIVLPKVLDEKGEVKGNCFNLDGLNKIAFYSNGYRYEGKKREGTQFAFTLTSHPTKAEGYDLNLNLEQQISNVHGYVNQIKTFTFSNDKQLKNITFTSNFTDYPWQGDDADLVVGTSAFSGCTGLKSVTMPQCKSTIGTEAFKGCTSLETADLSNVSYLNSQAFSGCSALKRVHLNDQLTALSTNAFYNCISLKSIVVPFANMNSFSYNAFNNCSNLKAVVVDATSLTSDQQVEDLSNFAYYNSSTPLYVTKDCYDKAFSKSTPENVKVYTDYRRMPRQYTDATNNVVELNEGYGSVCLPDEISLADSYNLKGLYSLQTIEGRTDAYGLKTQAQADVKAGKPYVFARCNDDNADPDNLVVFGVYNDDAHPSVSAPVADDNDLLVGTFEKIAAPTGSYILQSDNMFHPVRSSRNVGAYRAYLNDNNQSAAKVSLFTIDDDTPTGITSAPAADGDTAIDPSAPVYNLNGQRIAVLQKGKIYLMKGAKGYVKVRW